MLRHIILFNAKPTVSQTIITQAKAKFLALKNHLPGIVDMMIGECQYHEDNKLLFSHAICIDFKNQNALEDFFNNPITHPAKNAVIDIVVNGYAGISGFNII